jgi:hypothetical protein
MMGDLSHPIFETMATLDLTDEETLVLAAELKHTIGEDRYPLSPRIRTLQGQQARPAAGPRSRAAAEALRAAVKR